jgi:hypothetical protein
MGTVIPLARQFGTQGMVGFVVYQLCAVLVSRVWRSVCQVSTRACPVIGWASTFFIIYGERDVKSNGYCRDDVQKTGL